MEKKLNQQQRDSLDNIIGLKKAMNNAVVEFSKGRKITQFEMNIALIQLTEEIHRPQLEMYLGSMVQKPIVQIPKGQVGEIVNNIKLNNKG